LLPDRLQITDPESGASRTLEVQGDQCYVGVTAAGDIDLCDGAQGAVLRLERVAGGYRLEPVAAGQLLVINGEELYCKDLQSGDVIEVGRQRLRWVAAARPVSSPPLGATLPGRRPRGAGRSAAAMPRAMARGTASGRTRRPGAGLPALLPILITIASITGAVILFQVLWSAHLQRTPQHYLDLARAQFGNGHIEEARATLEIPLAEAGGRVRSEAEQLRGRIDAVMIEIADQSALRRGERDAELLHSFVARYLGASSGRPEAREFVRCCDVWLAEHEEPCGRFDEGRLVVSAVEEMRQRHWEQSGLPEPDDGEDVVFAARARLRFMVRDYRSAMAILDAFCRDRSGPELDRVERARREILAEGEVWLRRRLQMVERMLERNDRIRARSEMAIIDRRAVLPQWEELAAPVRERLK